jgi:hypothetical protein
MPSLIISGSLLLAPLAALSAQQDGSFRPDPASGAAAAASPAPSAPEAEGRAAPDVDLFGCFGYPSAPEAVQLPEERGVRGPADVVFTLKLDTIKNAYLRPSLGFVTGSGTRVYVSGTKAANCPAGGTSCKDNDKFFLVLTTARGDSYFIRAMDIVNWGIFMSGSRTVTIDGENYVAKVYANASAPADSRLEIKGPRGVALSATLRQIGDAVAAKGVDVTLDRAYKLAYGNEIVQGPQGGSFTSRMLVLLIPYPVVDASTYYIFGASEIKPSGTAFPSFHSGYGFKLDNGVLSIYRL